MRTIFAIFAATVLLGNSTPSAEYLNRNWAVAESGRSCTLIGFFEGKKILWLQYNDPLDKALVTLTDDAFGSAEAGKQYMVRLDFVQGDGFSKRYPSQVFSAVSRGEANGIERSFPGTIFLEYLASSDILGVTLENGPVLASLNLRGSSRAVYALRRCAKRVGEIFPSDPLEGAEIPRIPRPL